MRGAFEIEGELMTREEVAAELKNCLSPDYTAGDIEYVLTNLESMGAIKFDEPKIPEPLEALAGALSEALRDGGCLTAVRVNKFLEETGHKIFWAPFVSKNRLRK